MADSDTNSGDLTGAGNEAPNPEKRLSDWLDLTARVPDDTMYSWESQAAQYPVTGPPGISYFRGELAEGLFVDCLLYRDEGGELVGILNHYPTDIAPYERAGDQNVWVRPDRRRQGIGTALATEASIRWTAKAPLRDPGDVRVTESGLQWIKGSEKKVSAATRLLPVPPEAVYGEWLEPESLRQWICPAPAVVSGIEIDPRERGAYRIDTHEQGQSRSVTGRYLVLDPPRGLAFSWRCSAWDPSLSESWVSISLEPHGPQRTFMTIRHGQLPTELRDSYEVAWGRTAQQLEHWLAGR